MSSALAVVSPSAYWYFARATGLVALLLLTASVVLGILNSERFVAPNWPRFAVDRLHRDVSLLVLAVLVIHILTSVLDGFAPIKLTDAVIPLASAYRPLWMGLGAVAFDLLLAVAITSLVRRRLGYRTWRAVHWAAYACWPVALFHGLGTGSDAARSWTLALTAACVAAVLVAVMVRVARARPERAPLWLGLSVATPVLAGIFTAVGPLAPHWAARAGTPQTLIRKAHPTAAVAPAPARPRATAPRDSLHVPFTAQLSGTVTQTAQPGGAIVDLALHCTGGLSGLMRVRMAGAPVPGGGLSISGSRVQLTAVGLASALQGKIETLSGQSFVARVRDAAGTAVELHADLNIDNADDTVSGTLTGGGTSG